MDEIGFLKAIPAIYNANLNRSASIVPCLLGPIGHGKTSMAHAAARVLTRHTGREYTAHISQPMLMPFDDIRGVPVPQMVNNQLVSIYTWPHLLPIRDRLKSSVWMLDEYTKAGEDSALALGNAFLARVLGDAELPRELFVIAAGNRAGIDKSKDTTLPAHVVARMLMLDWRLTFRSWQPWAMRAGVHHMTVAYAGSNEHKVFGGGEPRRNEAFCTPRELTEADKLIQEWIAIEGKTDDTSYYPVADPDLSELLAGKIGVSAAEDLKAFALVGRHMPTWEDICRKPKVAKVPALNDQLGPPALYAITTMIASKLDAKSVPAVVDYIRRVPDEFQVPVLIRLGIDFSAEAAAAGFIDILLGSQDLTAAALIYEGSR